MDIKETEDRLSHITDTIEKIGAVIESDILKLADWIKRKYQLEDALKAARQDKGSVQPTADNSASLPCPDDCEHKVGRRCMLSSNNCVRMFGDYYRPRRA